VHREREKEIKEAICTGINIMMDPCHTFRKGIFLFWQAICDKIALHFRRSIFEESLAVINLNCHGLERQAMGDG
jgi:hypothetical protein